MQDASADGQAATEATAGCKLALQGGSNSRQNNHRTLPEEVVFTSAPWGSTAGPGREEGEQHDTNKTPAAARLRCRHDRHA